MPRTQRKRTRRTPDQQIADLKAQIAGIQARAERRQAKKDPTLRHVGTALRSIDKALTSTKDAALRGALTEARTTLDACLVLNGVPARRAGSAVARVDREGVVRFLEEYPGSKTKEVAEGMGLEAKVVSRELKLAREEGRVRSEGKARGTRYYAGAASGAPRAGRRKAVRKAR